MRFCEGGSGKRGQRPGVASRAALGKTAHDLEERLEAKMEQWAQVHEQLEARG
jgi:hypothetical protein